MSTATPYGVRRIFFVMSLRLDTTITFSAEIPADDLDKLNRSLLVLDYDTPTFNSRGLSEYPWRSPLLSLAQVLNWCHVLTGVGCYGRQRGPWIDGADESMDELGFADDAVSEPVIPECNEFDMAAIRSICGGTFRGDAALSSNQQL